MTYINENKSIGSAKAARQVLPGHQLYLLHHACALLHSGSAQQRIKTVHPISALISGYNCVFASNENNAMEAEHINSISNKLDDLAQRAAELRRYL